MMKCECGQKSDVVDSRPGPDGDYIRRRRKCKAGHMFTTFETGDRITGAPLTELSVQQLNQKISYIAALISMKLTQQSVDNTLTE